MILLEAHNIQHSYYYRITDEYLGIFFILALVASALLLFHRHYIAYLVTHIFSFPEKKQQKNKSKNEDKGNLISEILNSVLVSSVVALTLLIYLKPYEKALYDTEKVKSLLPFLYHTDNYVLWLMITASFLLLALIKFLTIQVSSQFLPGLSIISTWELNTRYVSYVISFISLLLCLNYILGYVGVTIFTYLSIILFAIALIFRALVSFAAGSRLNLMSKINFFIYLCTLEILPLLLGLKYISNQVG